MRKVLLLALVSMFFTATACSKSDESAPAALTLPHLRPLPQPGQ